MAVITEVPFSAATNPIDTVPQSDPGSEVLQTVVDVVLTALATIKTALPVGGENSQFDAGKVMMMR